MNDELETLLLESMAYRTNPERVLRLKQKLNKKPALRIAFEQAKRVRETEQLFREPNE